jgi:hypothetical protein
MAVKYLLISDSSYYDVTDTHLTYTYSGFRLNTLYLSSCLEYADFNENIARYFFSES